MEPSRPSTPEPATGKVVGGFRLGRQIGFGSFSKVFAAEHSETRRKAAIKVVRKPKNSRKSAGFVPSHLHRCYSISSSS